MEGYAMMFWGRHVHFCCTRLSGMFRVPVFLVASSLIRHGQRIRPRIVPLYLAVQFNEVLGRGACKVVYKAFDTEEGQSECV